MANSDEKTDKKKSGGISILAVLIFSILAAGSGGLFGFMVPGIINPETNAPKPHGEAEAEKGHGPPATARLTPLAPITTNLVKPTSTWIRLEAAIVIDKDLGPDATVITKKMSEDIIGYLRTVSIDQIEGPSGFQHLREDLNDRVRIRSEGKVSELVITSMIVE